MRIIYIIVLFIFLTGCYQVSHDDLFEEYSSQLVIDALINNIDTVFYVYVSYSANPTDTVNSYPVDNALVIINDDSDNFEILEWVGKGKYISSKIKGIPKNKYSLKISYKGNLYIAEETMIEPHKIFNTKTTYKNKFVQHPGYYVKLFFEKRDKNKHYYKLNVTKNGKTYDSYSDLIIFDDAYAKDTVDFLVPYAFSEGDTVTIDLNTITEQTYTYYYALLKQTTNSFSNIQSPLKNPPTNITLNPLGFFFVESVSRVNLIIKKPKE